VTIGRATAAALFVLTFAIIGAGSGCGGRSGSTSAGDNRPARIISCAPNLTEMLFALGAGDRIIGVTRYCRYPPEAESKEKLGDLFSPNLEAMVAARPDLIVLVPGNRKIQDFFATRPGPRIVETNACETIADIEATVLKLGNVIGDNERAGAIVEGIDAGLDSLRAAWEGAPPVRYLMVLGHDQGALEQIYVVGRSTYLTELTTLVGGINVVEAELGRYPIVTREAIVAMNPDVIFERYLGDRPATTAEKAALRALWNTMPTLQAVKTGRVIVMDDNHITINGIDLVASAGKIARLLHAEGEDL
jgi:iron complex transport system substrate-binding protein